MGTVTPLRPINWLKLRTDEAERFIRCIAQPSTTGRIIFTNHTWDRVPVRDIPRETVFDILRTGFCRDQPFINERGHWQVIIAKRIAGNREAGVVTVILEAEEKLIVRTVEWMDIR